eukprot:2650692-Rhodomonas_salina.2
MWIGTHDPRLADSIRVSAVLCSAQQCLCQRSSKPTAPSVMMYPEASPSQIDHEPLGLGVRTGVFSLTHAQQNRLNGHVDHLLSLILDLTDFFKSRIEDVALEAPGVCQAGKAGGCRDARLTPCYRLRVTR